MKHLKAALGGCLIFAGFCAVSFFAGVYTRIAVELFKLGWRH